MSLPSRGRGLKLNNFVKAYSLKKVAPFTGAWIEINDKIVEETKEERRSLHGGVD